MNGTITKEEKWKVKMIESGGIGNKRGERWIGNWKRGEVKMIILIGKIEKMNGVKERDIMIMEIGEEVINEHETNEWMNEFWIQVIWECAQTDECYYIL